MTSARFYNLREALRERGRARQCGTFRRTFGGEARGFGHSDLKTLDPDQWARLKVEYQRKCYQNAEKAIRDKLRRLQAANRCEADPAGS